jgi:hypothetical protein
LDGKNEKEEKDKNQKLVGRTCVYKVWRWLPQKQKGLHSKNQTQGEAK